MSIIRCDGCAALIDTDFNVEAYDERADKWWCWPCWPDYDDDRQVEGKAHRETYSHHTQGR